MALGRFCCVVVLAGGALGASVSSGFSAKDAAVTTSGLPVPRYVSLKSDHVNVRAGPTKDNDVAWVYTRSGLPVEITAEFENWRRSTIAPIKPARWPRVCRPASSHKSNAAPQAGVTSTATVLMAGSSSSGCGASTPTKRSSEIVSSSLPSAQLRVRRSRRVGKAKRAHHSK